MSTDSTSRRIAVLTLAAVAVACSQGVKTSFVTVKSMEVAPATLTLAVGHTNRLTVSYDLSDGTTSDTPPMGVVAATWSTSDETIATVDATGLVTAVKTGSATIKATSGALTATSVVTVDAAALTGITITAPASAGDPPTLAAGSTLQLTATGTFSDGSTSDVTSTVTWSSSAETTASLSASTPGLTTGVAAGSATITATSGSVSGQLTLTITGTQATLSSIAISPAQPTVARGSSITLTAIGTYSDQTTQDLTSVATWTSDTPLVASVSSGGVVNGLEAGQATITATVGAVSALVTVTVTGQTTLVSIAITPPLPTLARGSMLTLTATGTFSDQTTQDLTATATWTSDAPGVATVSGGVVSGVGVGGAHITATFNGISGSATVAVTNATLVSVVIDPPMASIAIATTQAFTATGLYSDNTTQDLTGQVTWASDSVVATVSTNGLATGVAAGLANITASIDSGAATLTATAALTVTPATLVSIAVTPTATTLAPRATQAFVATGTYSDQTTQDITDLVTWSSDAAAVATVSDAAGSRGLVTAVAAGSATITATLGAISGSTTLTVTPATLTAITVDPARAVVAVTSTQAFTATAVYSDGTTVDVTTQATWASSAPQVLSISNASGSEGVGTGVAAGQANVSASFGGAIGFARATVTAATLTSIQIAPINPTVAIGARTQLIATGIYSDNTRQNLTGLVTWTIDDATVAQISNATGTNGEVTGLAAGAATISATLDLISATATLTVTAATLQSITMAPVSLVMTVGGTQQITATGHYSDGTTQDLTAQATWTSSAATVASVSSAAGSAGLVTALAAGQATISAAFGGVLGRARVDVSTATLTALAVTPATATLVVGGRVQLTATGTFSDGTTQNLTGIVAWSSSDTTRATVSNGGGGRGTVTGIAAGSVTITALTGSFTATATITVTAATLRSIAVTPATFSITVGGTQQLTATATYSDGTTQDVTTQVTWASNNQGTAAVSNAGGSQGLVTGRRAGTTTISATLNRVTGTATATVTAPTVQSIEVTGPDGTSAPTAIPVGFTEQLRAFAIYSNGFRQEITRNVAWSSSLTTVATVTTGFNNAGLVTGVAGGTTTISATANGLSGTATVTVNDATLASISLSPAALTLPAGFDGALRATATYSDGSTLDITARATWTSTSQTVATVFAFGGAAIVRALAVGTTTITATFQGQTATTTVTVTNATLVSIAVIDPRNPTNTTVSVALDSTLQLQAIGTFSDGSMLALRRQVGWSSNNPRVATVSSGGGGGTPGLVTGESAGTATITAAVGGITGSVSVTVTP